MRGIPAYVAVAVAATAALVACDDEATIPARGDARGDVRSYEVGRRVDRLVVDAAAGSVQVRGTGENKPPAVTEHLHYDKQQPRTSHEIEGDALVLTATCPPSGNQRRCWVDYEITVEQSVEVVVQTGAGDVVVAGVTSSVEASTAAGDVRGSDLAASPVTASSDAGGVELRFVSQPKGVDATTSAGDVTIRLPAGTYAVDATTEVGERTVTVPVDSGSQYRVRARTEVGDVSVLAAG